MDTLEIESKTENLFLKWIKKFWKKIDKDDILNPSQKLAFDIFKLSLYDDNNIRYLNAKNSYKRYIVTKQYVTDKDISTFILLENGKITIVNHQYRYDIDIPEKTSALMYSMFDDKVQQEREAMEKEILSNITQSLEIVLEQFKDKLEKPQ
jgi:hypothetical protein